MQIKLLDLEIANRNEAVGFKKDELAWALNKNFLKE